MTNIFEFDGVVGDGKNDDTAGLQAALDSGAGTVFLPVPPRHYLISKPLLIHSNQTLLADRSAVIRLKGGSDCPMIANDDSERGNESISLIGGIWDMHNEGQSLAEYQKTRNWKGAYDPARYLGVLMRFNRVKNLVLRGLTFKDPVTYSAQLGNLDRFIVEDITFDHNLKRSNMDGIHVHGPSRFGRIANLRGATNDDMVALNADDAGTFEMCRGPIEDVVVGGLRAENGYTAVRLLSAGSPVRRIRLANIAGTYRYNVVSFTNHKVHPGEASTFDDISIQGVRCSKSAGDQPVPSAGAIWSGLAPIWIDAPAVVSSLSVGDYERTETVLPIDDIHIEPGATVENLTLNDITLENRCKAPINLLRNRGTIRNLAFHNVRATAEHAGPRGCVVKNEGTVSRFSQTGVTAAGLDVGM